MQAGRIVGEIYDALLKQYNSTPISSDGFTNVPPGGISENAVALAEASDKSELDNKLAAHEANDRAVLAAYGLAPDTPEPEVVAHLFKLYAQLTKEGEK